jgi:spore germination protein GerM
MRIIIMENQKQSRRLSLGLIAGISIAIVAVGAAWWAKNSWYSTKPSIPTTSTPGTVAPEKAPQTQQIAQEKQVEVYWISANATKIEAAPATIKIAKSSDQTKTLENIFQVLLAGPKQQEYTTTIPQGTKLLDLKEDQQGIHVNLSKEFATGGGSTAMVGRVAQIIYTATSLDKDANVWINIESKPLNAPLGGEGLLLDQPTNRQDFKNNFQL